MRRSFFILAVTILASIAVACGGASDTDGSFDGADLRALLSNEEIEAAIPLVIGDVTLGDLRGNEGMEGIDSLWGANFDSADETGALTVIVTDFESLELLQQQIAGWTANISPRGAQSAGDYLERTEPTIGDGDESFLGQEGRTIIVRFWKGDKGVELRMRGLPGTRDGLIALAELAESRLDGPRREQ